MVSQVRGQKSLCSLILHHTWTTTSRYVIPWKSLGFHAEIYTSFWQFMYPLKCNGSTPLNKTNVGPIAPVYIPSSYQFTKFSFAQYLRHRAHATQTSLVRHADTSVLVHFVADDVVTFFLLYNSCQRSSWKVFSLTPVFLKFSSVITYLLCVMLLSKM